MSSNMGDQSQQEAVQFSQNFRKAGVRSGDGVADGRGGDIGSYNRVNSPNTVNHHTTIHIHSDEQLHSSSRPPPQAPPSRSSLGSVSHADLNKHTPSTPRDSLHDSRPHFIFNAEGRGLDLSNTDQHTILAYPFHGGTNQQWLLHDNGQGRMALMSIKTRRYLAFKRLEEDEALFLSTTPFYWEVSGHGDKYRIGIPKSPQGLPQTNLALSIGSSVASLRPNFEIQNTLLHILVDTPKHRTKIQALEVASRNRTLITTPANAIHEDDNATFSDLYKGPRFIFNGQGKILDLSGNDNQTVIPWGFHGDWNQQWAFECRHNSTNLVALRSLRYPVYMAYQNLSEDGEVVCKANPVYWELSRDQDGYNLVVPGSHLGIGLVGETTRLRPLYEDAHTRLHFLETSEATAAEIKRGNFQRALVLRRNTPRPLPDVPRPSQLEPFLSTIDEKCHIVGWTGAVLDFASTDVIVFGFHGGTNQQWTIRTDGRGGATIQSLSTPRYIAVQYDELQLDSRPVLDLSPFTWEIFRDGGGYRFAVPGTKFALSVGICTRIRYLHEQLGTRIYLMDNSPQSQSTIRSGNVSSSTIQASEDSGNGRGKKPFVSSRRIMASIGSKADKIYSKYVVIGRYKSEDESELRVALLVNSDARVPRFKSRGEGKESSLTLEFQKEEDLTGFTAISGTIGQGHIRIVTDGTNVSIHGPIEGGPEDSQTFVGTGTWTQA